MLPGYARISEGKRGMGAALGVEQKRSLYQDGFVVLPGIVPRDKVDAARRRLYMDIGQGATSRGGDATFVNLLNETDLFDILKEALGPIRPARSCQLASNFPADPDDQVNEAGYRDRDTPFFGWHGHLDGLWNGATPIHQDLHRSMTAAELAAWNQEPARNGCRKCFPDLGANVMNFTALLGVALSDQTAEGAGNIGVLRGAHHEMERFFRRQRAAGGPLGPDGPDWERIDHQAPNGFGLRHYPELVRDAFAGDASDANGAAHTADGRRWPRPTLLPLAPGDAAIILHAVPHGATRVAGPEPRQMVYFRITPEARPKPNRAVYPDALCDIWREWPGMTAIVASERCRARSPRRSQPGDRLPGTTT